MRVSADNRIHRVAERKEIKREQPSAAKRVVLIDDHPLICRGLTGLIEEEKDLKVAATFGSAEKALKFLEHESPDIVILDMSLPGMHGLDLIANLQLLYPKLPILVLSMHDEYLFAARALKAGARGYVMKQEPAEKVVAAIRCVLAGNIALSVAAMSRIFSNFGVGNKQDGLPFAKLETLTGRELQVLAMLGEGIAVQEIALRLSLSPKTVATYRERLKVKLGLRSTFELAHYAITWRQGNNSSKTGGQPCVQQCDK